MLQVKPYIPQYPGKPFEPQHKREDLYKRKHKLLAVDFTKLLNPLSPNGGQHQFSPNDIHTLSRDMVMRVDKRITKVKLH